MSDQTVSLTLSGLGGSAGISWTKRSI